ncbi:MAG TPA: tyrosine-type recombinase/integrase [Isosphaeraceae bacterium]|jgi:integrase|nr:tyrosine-type recombinase/integrase [Isosphaeraceae bacterium]
MPQPIPFDRFRAEVEALWSYPARSRATATKTRQVLREFAGHLGPDATTAAITAPAVAGWVNAQLRDGRHPNTAWTLLGYLRAAANYANEAGYVERSPFGRRTKFLRRVRSSPPAAHAREAIGRVLGLLEARGRDSWRDGRLFALAALVAYTGLRRGEALGLTWGEVDLPAGLVRLDPARRLKTLDAARPVPLPARLAEMLAAWRPRSGSDWVVPRADREGPWVSGGRGGKPGDALKAAGRAAGVEGLTFASLRTTWATLAESTWGLSGPVIQRVLRHTTLATQEHYRRADEPALVAAVRAIDFRAA